MKSPLYKEEDLPVLNELHAKHARAFLIAKHGEPLLRGEDFALNTKAGRKKFFAAIDECNQYAQQQATLEFFQMKVAEAFGGGMEADLKT